MFRRLLIFLIDFPIVFQGLNRYFIIHCNIWVHSHPFIRSNSWILMGFKIGYRFFTFFLSFKIFGDSMLYFVVMLRWMDLKICLFDSKSSVQSGYDQTAQWKIISLPEVNLPFLWFSDLFTVIGIDGRYWCPSKSKNLTG